MTSLLPLRRYRDLPAFTESHAFCGNLRVVRERQVDDAPLFGRHRFKADGLAARFRSLSHPVSQADERLFAALLVPLDVNGDRGSCLHLTSQYKVDRVLQRSERFPTPPDQYAKVVPGDIESYMRRLLVLARYRPQLHVSLDLHQRKQLLQNLLGPRSHFIDVDCDIDCVTVYRLHKNPGLFGAYAQDALLALLQYLNFNL